MASDDAPKANPWDRGCPNQTLEHATRWIDPVTGQAQLVPERRPCLRLNWVWKNGNRPFFHDIIDQFPELCLGWTKPELQDVLDLLSGMAVMFEGRLRVMPQKAIAMRVRMTVSAATALLEQAERHIKAGRVPVLSTTTKARIIKLAEAYEIEAFGRILGRQAKAHPSLFD